MPLRTSRRAITVTLISVLGLIGGVTASASARPSPHTVAKPTVVLVHGAFADASGWNGVIERLQRKGYKVDAPANPLRSLVSDSAYLHNFLGHIHGPILLVGHSYGGAVITNAAVGVPNVKGLVYVSGFAPGQGERLSVVESHSKDSVLNSALVPMEYPTGVDGKMALEYTINPADYRKVFAGDLPAWQTAVMAASQRPVGALCFTQPSGPPAWKTLPSWAVIATGDKAAGTDVLLSMAHRAGAKITEVSGSHVIMVSQPGVVTNVILQAIQSLESHNWK